ncbi:PRMT7 [Symbiodinium natans]|uniref:PRMT7 protein n=1 Tax=Symbiodinium natans TaxID=878477 RepID=A0A812UH74_9DINO|nr:PRMT7 [Symbiodinium natans]
MSLLEDPQIEWRQIVVEAIQDVAVVGDVQAVELAALRLESSREEVRAAAQDALVALWKDEDEKLMEAILQRLESEVDYVRVAAGQAFVRVVKSDDLVAARVLASRLEHSDAAVRSLASVALLHFEATVCRKVMLATLHSPHAYARCTALSSLSTIGQGDMACIRAACRALQDQDTTVRALAIPVIRTLIAGQDPKCCVGAAKVAAQALEHQDPDVQHAGSLALVGISKVQNPPPEKKQNMSSKMTLALQMDMLRSSQLATLQPRRQYNDMLDDENEETFPKVSNEELSVVIAMLDRAELRANGEAQDDDSKDRIAASVVLDTLNAMADRSRAANNNMPSASQEQIEPEEEEEWEDSSGSDDSDGSFSSSNDAKSERTAPKKRLQDAVKKAFIGKLAAKNTKTLKAMGGEGGGPSIAEKMRKVHQKEGQMQSWRRVEALLNSGDLQKRQAGLKEVAGAAGIAPGGSTKEGPAYVAQRKAQAKRMLRTMATSDPCWQVREATLNLLVELASEANVDFLPAALEATGDAMWQVRCAALRASCALCVAGEAAVEQKDLTDAMEAIQGLVTDWNSFVSLEALGTLDRLSDLGSQTPGGLEEAFARALHHRDKEVRDKAGATLYRSANTSGHEEAAAQAIAELLAYLDPDVKDEACLLLKRVGPTSISVGAVCCRISHGYDEPTRCAALGTLAEFAKAGEEHPPGTATEGDEREKEKESTSEIRKVQERNQWAMKAAQATARLGLQDPAAVVRQEAIRIMGEFGPEAWQQALQTVQGMLENRSSMQPACRCSALEAVACLFAASDAIQSPQGGPAETLGKDDLSAILELIASCFEDPDADVRNVATSVLCGLTNDGRGGGRNRSVQAITVAAQRLGHAESGARRAAQAALEKLGGLSANRQPGAEASGNYYEASRAAAEALGSDDPEKRKGAQRHLCGLRSSKTAFGCLKDQAGVCPTFKECL